MVSCITDIDGNTALWDAISAKHHSIFRILYHHTAISDPYIAGDLLCTAAKRNDLMVMKGLLKNGLNIDSKDHHGLTAIQIALAENHVDMVKLLVMNGADVFNVNTYKFSSTTLNEMLKKRDVGYQIMLDDTTPDEVLLRKNEEERDCNRERPNGLSCPRVSIYRGHPLVRRDTSCVEAGRLIRLPNTLEEIKSIAGTFLQPHFCSSCSYIKE